MRGQTLILIGAIFVAGCRRREASVSSAEPGEARDLQRSGSIESGGHDRTFLYFVPPHSQGPMPLVIALHGRLGTGVAQEKLSHFSTVGAREGFVVAFPDGFNRSWNDLRGVTPATSKGYDDVAFIRDLIQWFVDKEHVDPTRVYVTGMSNGGFMASTLGCKLSDKIAAIASVAATFPGGAENACEPQRPVPTIIIAGDADPLVPYGGGDMGGGSHGSALSAKDAAQFWVKKNGCSPTPTTDPLPNKDSDDGTQTSVSHWSDCQGGADVMLFTVAGGGHTWPGGLQYTTERIIGKTSRDFDASERIWEFFKDKKR